jgi:hypothetical protein
LKSNHGSKNLNLTFYTDDLEYTKRLGLLYSSALLCTVPCTSWFNFLLIILQSLLYWHFFKESLLNNICFKGPIKDISTLLKINFCKQYPEIILIQEFLVNLISISGLIQFLLIVIMIMILFKYIWYKISLVMNLV